MKRTVKYMISIFLTSIFLQAATVLLEPPKVFIDKGACPFECCTYREWTVKEDTDLYSGINAKKVIAIAKANQKVTAVTGEVHSIPAKVVIKETHGPYKVGDVIYVLTYEGEGQYKVWHNGVVATDGEVDRIFDDVAPKSRKYWGESKMKPEATWWVKIKLKGGAEGWTKQTENFGNKDACG